MNYIFIDKRGYVANRSTKEQNGCTQAFLDKHYNGDVEAWLEDNKTNQGCFNCFECENCTACIECEHCTTCIECENCAYSTDLSLEVGMWRNKADN